MNGYNLYQTYLAMVQHFSKNSAYDYFKYSGKTNLTIQGYLNNGRRLQYMCVGLERKLDEMGVDPVAFFYPSFMHGGYAKFHPHKMMGQYNKFTSRMKDFKHTLWCDLKVIDKYRHSEIHQNQLHPYIWVLYNDGLIDELTLQFIATYIDDFMTYEASIDPLLWRDEVDHHRQRIGFLRRCVFCHCDTEELKAMVQNSLWTIDNKTTKEKNNGLQ